MYGINPYAPVNPAMAGVTQQRLANYQSQMPQMPTYQAQQFAPQPPMPLMMKGRISKLIYQPKHVIMFLSASKEGYTMSKKDEALAKFVEVVKKLSPEEFEEKYVKEDMMIYKLMIRTNGVWKGNLSNANYTLNYKSKKEEQEDGISDMC